MNSYTMTATLKKPIISKKVKWKSLDRCTSNKLNWLLSLQIGDSFVIECHFDGREGIKLRNFAKKNDMKLSFRRYPSEDGDDRSKVKSRVWIVKKNKKSLPHNWKEM